MLRGQNLNPPVNGIRPDPTVGNLVEVLGDATSRQNTLNVFLQASLTAPSMAPPKERWNWKRTNFGFNYTLGKSDNNTDGAFAVPATGSLAAEWGPAPNDVRNRLGVFFGAGWLRNFNANLNLNYSSGSPYTIHTGLDDNGDQIFNDRPAGVGRNSVRGRRIVHPERLLRLQHPDRPEEARADAAGHHDPGRARRQLQRDDDVGRRAAAVPHGHHRPARRT